MAKPKYVSKYYKEYQKQSARIRRLIRNYAKKGIVINYNIQQPKRLTKETVQRMRNITFKELLNRGKIYELNQATGELRKLDARLYRKFQRAEKEEKIKSKDYPPRRDDKIIDEIMSILNNGRNIELCSYCIEHIITVIDNIGRLEVAMRFSFADDLSKSAAYDAAYASGDDAYEGAATLLSILYGQRVPQEINEKINELSYMDSRRRKNRKKRKKIK